MVESAYKMREEMVFLSSVQGVKFFLRGELEIRASVLHNSIGMQSRKELRESQLHSTAKSYGSPLALLCSSYSPSCSDLAYSIQ